MQIRVKILKNDAKVPKYSMIGDAGMDLFSIENIAIKPGEIGLIHTGIALEIPEGYVGLIWDKGSVGMIHGQKTLGGVFDSNYRGEIIIALANLKSKPYIIERGDKITQMLIQRVEQPEIEVVKKLSNSNRGENRWGSTGTK